MKKLMVTVVLGLIFGAWADVRTNVWINVSSNGNWSDAANWENGEKPTADGSSFVIISNNLTSSAVYFTVIVDENASVRGIRYLQGGALVKNPTLSVSSGKTLTIGKDGIYGQHWGPTFNATESTHGRQMNVTGQGTVVLAESQSWQDWLNGVANSDWICNISCNLAASKSVNWLIGGMKHTIGAGSSENFFATTYLQKSVCLSGAENFSCLPKIVLSDTNCFNNAALTADEPNLSFAHTKGGTGYVDSEIVWDCGNATSVTPIFRVTQNIPTNENKTVFRGKWSGKCRGYAGVGFYGNGYQQGGHWINGTYDGMFRPSACQWWFDNDMSELELLPQNITSGNKSLQFNDVIFVLKHENAWKNVEFFVQKGRCGRLKGILTTNGRNFSNSVSVYQWQYPMGATALFGIAEPGYSEFNGSLQIGLNGDNGEKPVWLYAHDGGTVRFASMFVYTGGAAHFLPYQVWGGGTVVMSANQILFPNGRAPFYVRDGRLVVGGSGNTYGINSSDVMVGVSHPSTIAVRALEMEVFSATYSGDYQTLTLSSVRKPDGVTLAPGDKVLVNIPTDNTAPKYNGIYVVGVDTKVWTRAPEMNDPAQCAPDIRVTVAEGATFGGTSWFLHNESRRWCDIHSQPYTLTFNSADYCVAFLQEPHVNPDVALLLESGRTLTNKVDVVDNQSTGASILGAYDEGTTSQFTGPITITKSAVTLTAPSGSTCSFLGMMTGTVAVVKTGAGAVIVNPSDENLTITNLAVASGTLAVPAARLKSGLRSAEFAFTDGATAELNLSGDVDLDGWKFTVTGLAKPEDRDNPPTFDFKVTSSDGTVAGTPTIVLEGSEIRNWSVAKRGDVWQVRFTKPGMMLIFR